MSDDFVHDVVASKLTVEDAYLWSAPSKREDMGRCLSWRTGDWCTGSFDEPVSSMQVSAKLSQGEARQASPKVLPAPAQAAVVYEQGRVVTADAATAGAAQQVHVTHRINKNHTPRLLDNGTDVPLMSELRLVASITLFVLGVSFFMYIMYEYYSKWADQRHERRRRMLHAMPMGKVLQAEHHTPYSMAPHASPDWRSRLTWNPQPPPAPLLHSEANDGVLQHTPPGLAAAIKLANIGSGE
jgi:hypothetical protein